MSLKRQSRGDLLWIRDDFLNDTSDHGAVIVHGHSITTEVEIRANRIGIDTGAYRTGILSALYLEETERAIISAVENEDRQESRDSADRTAIEPPESAVAGTRQGVRQTGERRSSAPGRIR